MNHLYDDIKYSSDHNLHNLESKYGYNYAVSGRGLSNRSVVN